MNTKIIIVECESCYGYSTVKNKMIDKRYEITNCPYCGSDEIEVDEMEIITEDEE